MQTVFVQRPDGEVSEVEISVARSLVNGGHAVVVDEKPKPVPRPPARRPAAAKVKKAAEADAVSAADQP